jgi:hypothetical protein
LRQHFALFEVVDTLIKKKSAKQKTPDQVRSFSWIPSTDEASSIREHVAALPPVNRQNAYSFVNSLRLRTVFVESSGIIAQHRISWRNLLTCRQFI